MNTKIQGHFLFTIFVLVLGAAGATNPPVRWTTNWVEAHEDIRVVRGKVFNRMRSVAWQRYRIEVSQIGENFLIGRKFEEVNYGREYSTWLVITNIETEGVVTGQKATALALRVGTISLKSGIVAELVDRGTRSGSWMVYSNGVPFAVKKEKP